MESAQNPSAQPAATRPEVRTGQYVVLWPEPVSATSDRPIIGAVRSLDEETGRIVVEIPTIRRDAVSQLGANVVLMAAQTGSGIYCRHCELEPQRPLAAHGSPSTAVVLSASDEWSRIERRQAERANVAITISGAKRYPAAGGFRTMPAIIRNISTSGLLLETEHPVEIHDRLELIIPLSDGKPPLATRARVVRALISPTRPGVCFAGCRFEGLHPTEQSRILLAMPGLPAGSPVIG